MGEVLQLIMLDKNVSLEHEGFPTDVNQLEHILKKIDSLTICIGGPKSTEFPPGETVSAYRDGPVWRHRDCEIISHGIVCSKCVNLYKLLDQYFSHHHKPIQRVKRNASPETKQLFAKKNHENRNLKKHLTRKERIIKELSEKLETCVTEIQKKGLPELIAAIESSQIPENQKTVVKEIVNLSKYTNPTGRKYSHEWLLACLLLHIRSPKTYNFLRNQNFLPLPSKSTICSYLKSSNVGCGFDQDFFELFSKELQNYPSLARHGVLCFDEMKVTKAVEVNVKIMKFDGLQDYGDLSAEEQNKPYKNSGQENSGDQGESENQEKSENSGDKQADYALVFMYSSLGHNLRQPVAMFASRGSVSSRILASLIITGIIALEKIQVKIHALVCDGASTNRGVWSVFGMEAKVDLPVKNFFINPQDEKSKIFFISDVPHLFKCIRNNLLNRKKFEISGKQIKWDYYKKLHDVDSKLPANLRVCPKLTYNHIDPSIMTKMRVHLATQIFSKSVAHGLEFYASRQETSQLFAGSEGKIAFTIFLNDLFDLLNLSQKSQAIKSMKPDSAHYKALSEAINWLDSWEREVIAKVNQIESDLEYINSDDYSIEGAQLSSEDKKLWQTVYQERLKNIRNTFLSRETAQGLRMTLHSTIDLSKHLLENCGFEYVLTRKMNQDCLERFFGIIRQAGCQNDHPTLPTFMQLYHLLSVYKILNPPKFGNYENPEELQSQQPRITLDTFRKAFKRNDRKSYTQEHILDLQKKIDDYLDMTTFECDDIIETDINMPAEVVDCIIYYITGFICRRMRKTTKCDFCRGAFFSETENRLSSLADLINLKSRGKLIYGNLHLFTMFRKLEELFIKYIGSSDNVYLEIIEEITKNKIQFQFPCLEHASSMVSHCVHYYIVVRMRQWARQENRELKKRTNELRKQAKLVCNNKIGARTC